MVGSAGRLPALVSGRDFGERIAGALLKSTSNLPTAALNGRLFSFPPETSRMRFKVQPRDVPPEIAARRLSKTLAEFEKALPNLLARGFPQAIPTGEL